MSLRSVGSHFFHDVLRALHLEQAKQVAQKPPTVPAQPQRPRDTFETQPVRRDPYADARAIGQTLIAGKYQELLGRAPTAAELTAATDQLNAALVAGKNVTEAVLPIAEALKETPEAKLKAGVDGYTQNLFQENLHRPATADEVTRTEDLVKKLLSEGKNIFEAGAVCDYLMKLSPEYAQVHPFAPWVRDTFQDLLGRQPTQDELKGTEKVIGDALGQGKNIFEAGAVVQFLIKIGPEYQARHPDPRGKILDIAQGEVGTLEATNNNDGDVAKYPGYFGRGPESYCANFVSYVLSNAGVPADYFNTETMKRAFVDEGKWKGMDNPQPGDVVWFDWDRDGVTDHVGIVKSVNDDGSIHTIEGNTGNSAGQEGVWECDRSLDLINGFANPY
jgi:hypothetical protein